MHSIEMVVPGWGSGGLPLPGGWQLISFGYLPGLYWGGEWIVQPSSISSQFPSFYLPQQSHEQRFFANLQAVPNLQPVPEPGTMFLFGTGALLAARAARRRRINDQRH